MRLEVSLTKPEAAALYRRDVRYPVVGGHVCPRDQGATVNWPAGVQKTAARISAERKLLAALESQGVGG